MLLIIPSDDLVVTHTEVQPLAAKSDLPEEPTLFEHLHVLALLSVFPSLV